MSEKLPDGFRSNFENLPDQDNTKMATWTKMQARVNEVRDALGKPVEDGIKESVIAMNALGFTTSGSCEGHIDWSEKAPWVDFEVEGTLEARKKALEVFQQADNARQEGKKSGEDWHGLYRNAHALVEEAEQPMLEKARELGEYLDTFYQDRKVPFDTRLILVKQATWIRLINQGAIFQNTRDLQSRTERLAEYQKEMSEFTAFLKEIYFESDNT